MDELNTRTEDAERRAQGAEEKVSNVQSVTKLTVRVSQKKMNCINQRIRETLAVLLVVGFF